MATQDVINAYTRLQKALAPGALAETDENLFKIKHHIAKYNIVLDLLTEEQAYQALFNSVRALYFQLDWTIPAAKLEAELRNEHTARVEAKNLRDAARERNENSPQTIAKIKAKHEAEKAKEKAAREAETLRNKIISTIETYTVNRGPNRTDFTLTNSRKATMYKIAEQYKYSPEAERRIESQIQNWDGGW